MDYGECSHIKLKTQRGLAHYVMALTTMANVRQSMKERENVMYFKERKRRKYYKISKVIVVVCTWVKRTTGLYRKIDLRVQIPKH